MPRQVKAMVEAQRRARGSFVAAVNRLSPWHKFVLRHRKRGNLWIHLVSFACFWGGPLMAVVECNPWWLVLFMISGGIGALGHALYRDGGVSVKEATSSPQVVWFVTVMFARILTGRYRHDVASALAALHKGARVQKESVK